MKSESMENEIKDKTTSPTKNGSVTDVSSVKDSSISNRSKVISFEEAHKEETGENTGSDMKSSTMGKHNEESKTVRENISEKEFDPVVVDDESVISKEKKGVDDDESVISKEKKGVDDELKTIDEVTDSYKDSQLSLNSNSEKTTSNKGEDDQKTSKLSVGSSNKNEDSLGSLSNGSILDIQRNSCVITKDSNYEESTMSDISSEQINVGEKKIYSPPTGPYIIPNEYKPDFLETLPANSKIYEYREHGQIVSEGFFYKRFPCLCCFWQKNYLVLLKTGMVVYHSSDGTGNAGGNYNVLDLGVEQGFCEGGIYPFRVILSNGAYFAFDKEEDRDHWYLSIVNFKRNFEELSNEDL